MFDAVRFTSVDEDGDKLIVRSSSISRSALIMVTHIGGVTTSSVVSERDIPDLIEALTKIQGVCHD